MSCISFFRQLVSNLTGIVLRTYMCQDNLLKKYHFLCVFVPVIPVILVRASTTIQLDYTKACAIVFQHHKYSLLVPSFFRAESLQILTPLGVNSFHFIFNVYTNRQHRSSKRASQRQSNTPETKRKKKVSDLPRAANRHGDIHQCLLETITIQRFFALAQAVHNCSCLLSSATLRVFLQKFLYDVNSRGTIGHIVRKKGPALHPNHHSQPHLKQNTLQKHHYESMMKKHAYKKGLT